MSETTSVVIKGDLDSTIHQNGFGSFGNASGSFGIIGFLFAVKILGLLVLIGLYYLFSWNLAVALLGILVLIVLIVLYFSLKPKRIALEALPINPHAQRAAHYEAEGNVAMAEHTRRIHGL